MTLALPSQMTIENVPTIPVAISDRVQQYMLARSAFFCDWHPQGQGMLISTRFGDTYQLHHVAAAGAARTQLTFYPEPLYSARYCRAEQEEGFVFSMDIGGAEAYQVYYFDLKHRQRTLLTDGESRNGSPLLNHQGTLFAYSSTRRNERDHDIYLSDLKHPDANRLICKVQGLWAPVAWSRDNSKLLLLDYISATETYYHLLDLSTEEVSPLFPDEKRKIAYGDAVWNAEGTGLYFVADLAEDFMQLHYLELASGAISLLTPEIHWNITDLELSHNGQQLAFTSNENGLSKLYLLNTSDHSYQELELEVGVVGNARFSPDDSQLAFSFHRPNHPADVYALELSSKHLQRWTYSEVGGLDTRHFPVPELIHYPSFDARQIPAFYFKPAQKSDRPYPVIIHIHGGPESQYRPTYSSLFQYWLNELDIAVVAPNVRGSSGYGKEYIEIDNGYLREDSVKDIGALLDWIAAHPELDEKRVCVYGGSYGGYMVLASLCHYSPRLRCGIDIVGISNFVTFLKNTKSYRRDLRRVEYGDERDPEMCAFLESISPTTNAHKIQRPLMVAQGLNDPRVPASEAEQIVKTVRENGQEVWYLLARDEGHGFHKQPNLHYYYSAISLFLERHLLD